MTRRGLALPVALLVVLLGAALVVGAVGAATAEIRSGWSWRASHRAEDSVASRLADLVPSGLAVLDTLLPGTAAPLAQDSLYRLGTDIGLVTLRGVWGDAEAGLAVVVRRSADGSGWVPISARSRLHPLP